MHCVVGSGPAGVACAKALLQRGATVQMLDAGLELEPERARVVGKLSAAQPSGWSAEDLAVLKEGMTASGKGIPLKRIFGSDFPYRETDRHLPAHYDGVGLRPSLALGGLSNVWGAAMLPYADADLEGWPLKHADLAAHYRAVLEWTGLAASRDDLEELFPLHLADPIALQASRQSDRLFKKLQRHRVELQRAGIHSGRARLAVRAARTPGEPGCVYCGLCMYGCPYGHIYNSAETVRRMKAEKNFMYQSGVIVTTVREFADRVLVAGYHRSTQESFTLEARRVYLAAGPISTTRIVLQSQAAYDEPVRLRDSQYFLFPLLLWTGRLRDLRAEALHTLSQLFVEIRNPAINRHTVHLQVYSYNDLIGQAVRKSLGPFARLLEFLARQMEERLLIVQGYLHSDDSAAIRSVLRKAPGAGADLLELHAETNPETPRAIRRVLRALLRHARHFGAVPVPPLLQVAEPGRGFHSGGSLPMRAEPERWESDRLGRPGGWQRIHAVDASVFPSIPATTITFTAMANAHRIGWESAELP